MEKKALRGPACINIKYRLAHRYMYRLDINGIVSYVACVDRVFAAP